MTEMPKTVTACVLVIGNEILSGRTKDANIQYLAVELNKIGVRLMEARVIPDIEATIVATVNEVCWKFDESPPRHRSRTTSPPMSPRPSASGIPEHPEDFTA